MGNDPDALGDRPLAKHAQAAAHDHGEVDFGFVQRQPAGLGLGKIQNVVDDPQQMVSAVVDVLDIRGVAVRSEGPENLAQEDLREAYDGV